MGSVGSCDNKTLGIVPEGDGFNLTLDSDNVAVSVHVTDELLAMFIDEATLSRTEANAKRRLQTIIENYRIH